MLAVNVKGGTNAGTVRPPREIPKGSWGCGCGATHARHWRSCPDNGGRAPRFRRPDLR